MGFAIDQPISIVRSGYQDAGDNDGLRVAGKFNAFSMMPVWNREGAPEGAVYAQGTQAPCKVTGEGCVPIKILWPNAWSLLDGWRLNYLDATAMTYRFWHGSLLEDKKDAAGLAYRRNRYYDPGSGRFTQEDPIGLAGGLNLYGFANGDPVNFSDPFGLCPPENYDYSDCPPLWKTRAAGKTVVTGGTGVFGGKYERTTDALSVTHTIGIGWGIGAAVGIIATGNLDMAGGPKGFHLFGEGLAAMGLVALSGELALDSQGGTVTGGMGLTTDKYPLGAGASAGIAFSWQTQYHRPPIFAVMQRDATVAQWCASRRPATCAPPPLSWGR